ncbi:MAG TPA: septal ring lytic transglycosylase RlpA family protein [Rudaea sp.]|jgi:rare lipoprotein A|uniref:septal ring lytic transglycosylase RlpA family protein n=1 Tax=Rudaea sp. TaxID=2136325 RepID=UPI002F92D791
MKFTKTHCGISLLLAVGIAAPFSVTADPAPGAAPPPAPAPSVATKASAPAPAEAAKTHDGAEHGLAAVYSDRLNGHRTASGERYNRNTLTAAHKTLAFGTHVKVTNTKNGKSVEVRINDRGPVQAGRILDLSVAAAHAIGIGRHGTADVSAEVLGK